MIAFRTREVDQLALGKGGGGGYGHEKMRKIVGKVSIVS